MSGGIPGEERPANPARGECALRLGADDLLLRPSFAALVAAEAEIGPLFAFVEQVSEGRAALTQTTALLWHCLYPRPQGLTREQFGDAVLAQGLASVIPALGRIIAQILRGA